jgi:hypothetical protein
MRYLPLKLRNIVVNTGPALSLLTARNSLGGASTLATHSTRPSVQPGLLLLLLLLLNSNK